MIILNSFGSFQALFPDPFVGLCQIPCPVASFSLSNYQLRDLHRSDYPWECISPFVFRFGILVPVVRFDLILA